MSEEQMVLREMSKKLRDLYIAIDGLETDEGVLKIDDSLSDIEKDISNLDENNDNVKEKVLQPFEEMKKYWGEFKPRKRV